MAHLISSLSTPHPPTSPKWSPNLSSLILHQMETGLRGQAGDNVRDLAERDYRHESGHAQTRRPAMAGRNVRDLPNSIRTVCWNDAQVNVFVNLLINKLINTNLIENEWECSGGSRDGELGDSTSPLLKFRCSQSIPPPTPYWNKKGPKFTLNLLLIYT